MSANSACSLHISSCISNDAASRLSSCASSSACVALMSSLTTGAFLTRMARRPKASDWAVSSKCSLASGTAMSMLVLALPPRDS